MFTHTETVREYVTDMDAKGKRVAKPVQVDKPSKPEHIYRWGAIEARGFAGHLLEAIDWAARLLFAVVPWFVGMVYIAFLLWKGAA